ncbi:MAG: signal transduction histidine kinase, partial [Myxococcota bacterium]
AALTLLLSPLQARLERGLDRLFLRNHFHYRRQLARMPEDLAVIRTSEGVVRYALERLVRFALERVGGVMELEAVVMVLSPVFSGDRLWRRTRGLSVESSPSEEIPWAVMAALDAPAMCRPDQDDALNQWMLAEGLEIALPMRTPEGLLGVLLCSGFPSRRAFDSDDVEALLTASGGLALSLGHTLSYERLQQLNAELEERIEQRTAQLNAATVKLYSQEKMASLGVLAAGVAHELNTPIGVVLSTSEMLTRALPEADRTHRMSSLCQDAARRAAEIVTDLRSFSRPELQGLEEVNLTESIDLTLRLLSGRLRDADITVVREIEPEVFIEGSPAMINQAISNLTRNAVQAMEPNGGALTVGVTRVGASAWVTITDTGPGISEEIRGRIFEPFFTTRPPGQGTGLGLSLCFTFIAQHHGRIWEDGALGAGARFIMELPIRQPREELSHA